jgi:hypothetical protein
MTPKSRRLLLLFAWAVATGLQVPRIVALARFDARSAAVHEVEGPAWGAPRGVKRACTVSIQPRGGGGVVFGCDALPVPGPWVTDGEAARVRWIFAPYGDFGGDVPVPLSIVQGPKVSVQGDADERVRDLWRHLFENLAWTQGVAAIVLLLLLFDAGRERARASRASREANERWRRR